MVMHIHVNTDDYPYDYELEIWKDPDNCVFYARTPDFCTCCYRGEELYSVGNFDQFLTIGQSLRHFHTGKADRTYTWRDIDFYNGPEFQKKIILDMRWEEVCDSGALLPLKMNITFPEEHGH